MKKIISLISALVLVFLSVPVSFAAANSRDFANLIVFVKLSGETNDTINEVNNGTSNYSLLKSYYDRYEYKYSPGVDVSLKSYVNEVSRGKVNVLNYFPQENGDAVSVLSLSNTTFNGTYDEGIIDEVITAFENGVISLPSGKLDNDESGILDNLTVVFEVSEADYEQNETTTSHKSISGTSRSIGGLSVRRYNVIPTYAVFGFGLDQGVITHEFMHTLGFADLYRYGGSGSPVGYWDLMAGASPYMQYPLSYMRHTLGWVPATETNIGGHYSLDAVTNDTGNVLLKLKTPMSNSEFFCLEYRQKNTSAVAGFGFESKINSGLLIYRVNTALDELNNKDPEKDFIYVYRPDDTDAHASGGNIMDAAVNPDDGETSYGSADFSAEVSANTIFYSSGKNSGIVISNIAYNADKSKIEFDIEFPDFSSLNLWKTANGNIYNDYSPAVDIFTYNNTAYAAASNYDNEAKIVFATPDNTEEILAQQDIGEVKVIATDNGIYTASLNMFCDTVKVTKTTGTTTTVLGTYSRNSEYFNNLSLFTDGENVYAAFISNSNTVVILSVGDSGVSLLDDTLPCNDNDIIANPDFCCYDGKIYVLYSVFNNKHAMLKCYDSLFGGWSDIASITKEGTSMHKLDTDGEKLYGITGGSGKTSPVLITYDGNAFTETELAFQCSTIGLSLAVGTDFIAVSFIDNFNSYIYCDTGNGFTQLGDAVSSDTQDIKIAASDNRIWAIVVENSAVVIKSKSVRKPVIVPAESSGVFVNNSDLFIQLPKAVSSLEPVIGVLYGGELSSPDNGIYYGTGRRIVLSDADGEAYKTYSVVVPGDLDGDGAVDVLDSQISELTCSNHLTLSGAKKAAADFNADGNITEEDFTQSVNASLAD